VKIGFIGLGTMGAHMAANLQKAGHDLIVHDVRRDAADSHIVAGATWAASPQAVGADAEVVFLSLPGPPEVEAVTTGGSGGDQGLLSAMASGSACFDLSTNSPTVVRQLHAAFAEKGVEFMDAPVSGGPRGAESGKLSLWIGGSEAIFNKYKPVLDAIGDQAAYIGSIGAGSVAKLVHNCGGKSVQCALAEVFTLGVKAGVPALNLWEAVRQGAIGRSNPFDSLTKHFLPNDYDPPDFALRLAHKDVSLALELARDVGVPMRFASLALEELTEALNRGWSERDSRVAMLLQQERAGVKIAVDPERVNAAVANMATERAANDN
jgi:3-hydroxyisobutyrate dehydrogenase-like beta-hydroxyacid dehydrogenase